MDSAELVRLIQDDSRPLIESHYAELRTNLGTSHYHRLSTDELFRRGQAVLQHLIRWLSEHDDGAVRTAGEDLGRRRFAEGIPLGQVVLALILEEDHLWSFAGSHGLACDESVKRPVSEFFARMIYGTAHGYERSLAESNHHAAHGSVAAPAAAAGRHPAAPSSVDSKSMEVSRGGQVGEHGG